MRGFFATTEGLGGYNPFVVGNAIRNTSKVVSRQSAIWGFDAALRRRILPSASS